MRTEPVPLDRPLPAELLRRLRRGFMAYQQFPVFSWPWLQKRSALLAAAAGSFACLVALSLMSAQDERQAWWVGLQFFVGALAISSSGPLLATLVRHRALPFAHERRYVIAALALGVLVSFAVDLTVSRSIEASLPERLASDEAAASSSPKAYSGLNLVALLVIYGLAGGGLALRRYLAEGDLLGELEKEREVAELRARNQALHQRLSILQAQIEPHFLFNTLASVRALIPTDPELAATVVEKLVDYLRALVPRLRESSLESTLGQQLEICESYLQLMRVRSGKLSYQLAVEPRLHGESFPPLLLFSLVENAIKHGIEPKLGRGHIELRAELCGEDLCISVADDGVGLSEGMGSGVGLSNAREQLLTRYGARASLTLTGKMSGGVLASIRIPRGEVI